MRIQYLVAAAGIPVRGPSGASAHVRGITGGLASLGHQVEIHAARETDRRGEHGRPAVPCSASGVAGWPSWLAAWRHWREVRTSRRVARAALRAAATGARVDLLIERHALFSDAGLRTAHRLRVPWILEINAPQRLERSRFENPPPAAAAAWERRVLQAAPSLVAVSAWLARWLVEEAGCHPDRVRHIPNGVSAARGDRAAGRLQLGLEPEDFAIGFIGSFRSWHGVQLLAPLLARLPEARLLLVGGAREQEEAQYRGLCAQDRVIPVGRVSPERVPDLVAAMDVGLAPYPDDAPPWFCPLKVLEYRAQGTPVVASDIGDCRLLTGKGGTIVPPGDLDAMASAVRTWRDRRPPASTRSWAQVARELLDGQPLLDESQGMAAGLGKPDRFG